MSVRESLDAQRWSCAANGSPLYGALLVGLAHDFDRAGLTAVVLDGVSERPQHDALPLRYLATAHRLALSGAAPNLAQHFASCGGAWDGSDQVVADFLSTVAEHREEFHAGVRRNVQTNEVGRAAALATGFSYITRRHGFPVDQLEIGSSAGLLSSWDSYSYDTGVGTMGDKHSALAFDEHWWIDDKPVIGKPTVVIRRRASDIDPIDVHSRDGRLVALSFVWPDQAGRVDRLRSAISIAEKDTMTVDRADAGDWLAEQLANGPSTATATVVFHSIVWQYLSRTTRQRARDAIHRAGELATADAPLFWMRFEPANRVHAELRLMSFPPGSDELLANVGYHGRNISWVAQH